MGFQTSDMAREWSRSERDSRRRAGIRVWHENGKLYSYETEIARKLPNGMTWVTSQTYSVSTSRHTRDAISYSHGQIVRSESCPSEETIQEMIEHRDAYARLMERAPTSEIREPPARFEALLALRDAMPAGFEPLIAQRIFDRICDRYKKPPRPIVIDATADQPELTDVELRLPERTAKQAWFNLARTFAASLGIYSNRLGTMFDRRMAKVCGLIQKDFARFTKIGPRGRVGRSVSSNTESPPPAGVGVAPAAPAAPAAPEVPS